MRANDRGRRGAPARWRRVWLASAAMSALAMAGACSSSSNRTATGAGGSGGSTTGGGGGGGSAAGGAGGEGTAGTTGAAGGSGADGGVADADGGPGWSQRPVVPPALEPPADSTLAAHFRGVGTQVYTCTASGGGDGDADAGPTTYAWVLKTPDAKLFDEAGVQVGTHTLGPTWTFTADGSSVVGARVQQANAPLADAIPWLLLRASSNTGSGLFSDVTYVQRVGTMGGKAPASGCASATVGNEAAIYYSADYYFYTGGATGSDAGSTDATSG